MRRVHRERRIARVAPLAMLTAGALLFASCGGEPTGPGAAACTLPATSIDRAATTGITTADLHAAALDATTRLVSNVGSGAAGSSLTTSVASLDQGVAAGDVQLACRSARNALATLDGLAADPASAPDRGALRLVIELLTASIGAE
jgi:hypothetical protein